MAPKRKRLAKDRALATLVTTGDAPQQSQRIAALRVTRLFGHYDYKFPNAKAASLSDMVILYGDNGCGKTTLLKLIFHLLSPGHKDGHRTAVYQIPFASIEITFSDGSSVSAKRTSGTSGELTLSVQFKKEPAIRGKYSKDREEGFESAQFEQAFLAGLKRLNLALYYLSDDRQLVSDELPKAATNTLRARFRQHLLFDNEVRVVNDDEDDLASTLATARDWIRRQSIQASNAGTENVNTIYLNILKRLSEKTPLPSAAQSDKPLKATLTKLGEISEDFSRFGFAPQFDVNEILSLMSSVSHDRRDTMIAILAPYVNGISARLESLTQVQTATAKLVDGLTSFFSGGKKVLFDVAQGFRFLDANGQVLRPEWLSSGEQHLVKLFCCTLISRDRPSIFLVDEPELSLNIKWQRILLTALASLAEGSPNQFFFATHSIEILSQHKRQVEELATVTQS